MKSGYGKPPGAATISWGAAGPGSVKYEGSWGIEESLEQFQGLVRQHPGWRSWALWSHGFPMLSEHYYTDSMIIIHAHIVHLSYIIYINMLFQYISYDMSWYTVYKIYKCFLLQRKRTTSVCSLVFEKG